MRFEYFDDIVGLETFPLFGAFEVTMSGLEER